MLSDKDIEKLAQRISTLLDRRIHTPEDLVDIHQAAELLGCSISTVERRTKDGQIPSVKLGRLRRYRRIDLTLPKPQDQ